MLKIHRGDSFSLSLERRSKDRTVLLVKWIKDVGEN